MGYAGGNNVGLRAALDGGADFFVLLNNDTVVSPDFLDSLTAAAEKYPEAGIYGPYIYEYEKPATLWYAGGGIEPNTGRCYHLVDPQKKEVLKTDYICGCCIAFKREVLEKVGFLPEEYFLLWEEVDWCFKAKTMGFTCLVVPAAKIWHKVSQSFEGGNHGPMWHYFYARNRILFHKRHFPAKPLHLLSELIKLAWMQKSPKPLRLNARAAFFGVSDALLGRFGKGRLAKFLQIK